MDRERFENLWKYKPTQDNTEFFWLVNLVDALNPHIIIEIGIGNGGSFRYWEQILKPGDLLIGVDVRLEHLEWDIKASDRDIRLIEGKSQNSEVVDQVKKMLSNRKVDFVFQDGGHSYLVAVQDFENFSRLLREEGVMAFHDINTEKGGVGKFFEELESKHPRNTAKMVKGQGTGVWRKP